MRSVEIIMRGKMSSNECDNKNRSCGQKVMDHQNTKPSNVKTVFRASYPVTEATP
jgi:hypothetical protein